MISPRERTAALAAQRELVRRRLADAERAVAAARADQADIDAVQRVVQYVAARVQTGFGDYVGAICTKAVHHVFPDRKGDAFVVRFRENRGKTECQRVLVSKGGSEAHPFDCAGGGVWDVLGFALQGAMIALEEPKPSLIMFTDEPFKFIHGREKRRKALSMLRNVSVNLGIQMIIIHQSDVDGESVDESLDVISGSPGCAVYEVRKVAYEKSEIVRIGGR